MSLSYIPLCLMSTIFYTNVMASDPFLPEEPSIHIKISPTTIEFAKSDTLPIHISPRDKDEKRIALEKSKSDSALDSKKTEKKNPTLSKESSTLIKLPPKPSKSVLEIPRYRSPSGKRISVDAKIIALVKSNSDPALAQEQEQTP